MPNRFISAITWRPNGDTPCQVRFPTGVSERDVAHAALVEVPQVGEVVLDRRAVLHAERDADLALGVGAGGLARRMDDREHAAVVLREPLDQIDQRVGEHLGAALLVVGRNVDREERPGETAFLGAHRVEVAAQGAQRHVLGVFEQAVGDVDMGVGDARALGDRARPLEERGIGRGGRHRTGQGESQHQDGR